MGTPKFNKARYKQIVDHFEARLDYVLPNFNFLRTPWYFASLQDFYATVKTTDEPSFDKLAEGSYKALYAILSYGTFTDDKTHGWDIDPTTRPAWNLQLFCSHIEARLDEAGEYLPNSHDILVDALIDLRNDVLVSREISNVPNEIINIETLTQRGDMVLQGESPFIISEVGDWINIRLTVEVV